MLKWFQKQAVSFPLTTSSWDKHEHLCKEKNFVYSTIFDDIKLKSLALIIVNVLPLPFASSDINFFIHTYKQLGSKRQQKWTLEHCEGKKVKKDKQGREK